MMNATRDSIVALLESSRTVAVLGASNRESRPAHYVPAYLARNGYDVYPVNPRHTDESLWDRPVVATLAELPVAIDVVNVFRRSQDVPGHVDDILAMRPLPKAVWLQLGIRNDEAARRLQRAGIEVIQDRCILIDHRAMI